MVADAPRQITVDGRPITYEGARQRYRELYAQVDETRTDANAALARWGWFMLQIKNALPHGAWTPFRRSVEVHDGRIKKAMRLAKACVVAGRFDVAHADAVLKEWAQAKAERKAEHERAAAPVPAEKPANGRPGDVLRVSAGPTPRPPAPSEDDGDPFIEVYRGLGMMGGEAQGGQRVSGAAAGTGASVPAASHFPLTGSPRAGGTPPRPAAAGLRGEGERREARGESGKATRDVAGQLTLEAEYRRGAQAARGLAGLCESEALGAELLERLLALAAEAGVEGGEE